MRVGWGDEIGGFDAAECDDGREYGEVSRGELKVFIVVEFRHESPRVTGTARRSGVRVHGACIWMDVVVTHQVTGMCTKFVR